jgi:O-antigen/teichoic acid export membrane protein
MVAIYGKEIIKYIFDQKYLVCNPVMIVLLAHYSMLAFPVALPLQAVEKPEFVLLGKISSLYNFVMDIILIQFWGIYGVAIATTSAIILKKLFEYNMSKKYAGITFPWKGISKISFNCMVICILGLYSKQYINNMLSLFIVLILFAVIYLLLSSAIKIFNSDERDFVNNLIGRPYFIF